MKALVEKLRTVERDLCKQYGEFDLFALFLREDAGDKWDLMVAGRWIDQDKTIALKRLTRKIQETFSDEEMLKMSRVILVAEDDPALRALQHAMRVEHGSMEIRDSDFFGLPVKHAYVITSRNRDAA